MSLLYDDQNILEVVLWWHGVIPAHCSCSLMSGISATGLCVDYCGFYTFLLGLSLEAVEIITVLLCASSRRGLGCSCYVVIGAER